MINFALIWSIFSLIFLCLGIYHFTQSFNRHPLFEEKIEDKKGCSFFNATAVANEKRIEKFVEEFNFYIKKYNNDNSSANRYACYGYFSSAIISLLSLLIELNTSPCKYTQLSSWLHL